MKKQILILFLLIHSTFSNGQNLISNGRFQYPDLKPRCDGWFNLCGEELTAHCDTNLNCYVGLVIDSPSWIPEDIWSLQVKAAFEPDSYAETYITGQTGTNIYTLTYWMNAKDWAGGARIGTGKQSNFVESQSRIDTCSSWSEFTLTDTITTKATDTITVRLSAGSGDFCICPPIRFAFIELVKKATNAVDDVNPMKSSILAYPNPAQKEIKFEVKNKNHGSMTLEIFNSSGTLVLSKQSFDGLFLVNRAELPEGLYIYCVTSDTDQMNVGRGKFIFD